MSMTPETTAATDAVGLGRGGRMSRQRKREAVLRLLRGEELELVSRALGVTAATLSGWRAAFLAAGEVEAMSRTASPSSGPPSGLARVCRVWRTARATVYRHRAPAPTDPPGRRGPPGPMLDAALVEAIRTVLSGS